MNLIGYSVLLLINVLQTVCGGSQPSHYRMSTSTTAERRRTDAAWPLVVPLELRAQITRFEDVERSPLATRYAQYIEWKVAIRADAACRIQALFRGASTRWMLLRLVK